METKPYQIKMSDGVKTIDPSQFKLLGKTLDYWIEINALIESKGVDGLAAEIVKLHRELTQKKRLVLQFLDIIQNAVERIKENINQIEK